MLHRWLFGLALISFFCVLTPAVNAQDGSSDSDAEVASDGGVDEGDEHAEDGHAADDGHGSGDAHGDEHADTDPTHANMSDGARELTEFRTDIAFFTAIVFLLLLAGLFYAAWKPIMEGLEKREARISGNIAKAEKDASAAAAKLAEYEAQLATANEEAQQIVAEARKDAEATEQKIVAAAQEEAARQRERATAEIESAKRVALSELADQSTAVAMSLAQRVVGREVKAEDHQGLIQEMLSKLPSNN